MPESGKISPGHDPNHSGASEATRGCLSDHTVYLRKEKYGVKKVQHTPDHRPRDTRVVLAFEPASTAALELFQAIPGPTNDQADFAYPTSAQLQLSIKPRGKDQDACAPITIASGLLTLEDEGAGQPEVWGNSWGGAFSLIIGAGCSPELYIAGVCFKPYIP